MTVQVAATRRHYGRNSMNDTTAMVREDLYILIDMSVLSSMKEETPCLAT